MSRCAFTNDTTKFSKAAVDSSKLDSSNVSPSKTKPKESTILASGSRKNTRFMQTSY